MRERTLRDCPDDLCERVIGAAIAVHRELGPGLLESAYERALAFELGVLGIPFQAQVEIPLDYRGNDLGPAFRADLIIDDRLLLELKAVSELTDLHMAQIMTYLRLLRFKRGFQCPPPQRWHQAGINLRLYAQGFGSRRRCMLNAAAVSRLVYSESSVLSVVFA